MVEKRQVVLTDGVDCVRQFVLRRKLGYPEYSLKTYVVRVNNNPSADGGIFHSTTPRAKEKVVEANRSGLADEASGYRSLSC